MALGCFLLLFIFIPSPFLLLHKESCQMVLFLYFLSPYPPFHISWQSVNVHILAISFATSSFQEEGMQRPDSQAYLCKYFKLLFLLSNHPKINVFYTYSLRNFYKAMLS